MKEYMKKWRKTKIGKETTDKNKKKYRESEHGKRKAREFNLRKKYSMTLEDYDNMFEEQNGVCAICGEPEVHRRLSVDHDHKTGEIRSLLCARCNCCIGVIEKKNLSLKDIQKYLER